MQAKDREITLLQQQLGEKVSHELLLTMKNFDISMHEYQSRREREWVVIYLFIQPCLIFLSFISMTK